MSSKFYLPGDDSDDQSRQQRDHNEPPSISEAANLDIQSNWQSTNQHAWDRMAESRHILAKPATAEQFENPLASVDGPGWLGSSIEGQRVLCLAAGGGRQGPLYAAAGAVVTIVDLSPAMLKLDQEVARQHGLQLKTVQASMDRLEGLEDAAFDLVIHPVSTCYVPNLQPVYREVARVTRCGGLYISQHKQPVNLQADLLPQQGHYPLVHDYYRQAALPDFSGKSQLREPGAKEFLHRWEELMGLMCRAGFSIEDVLEPFHAKPGATPGTLGHRSQFIAPYVRIKARRQ